MGYEGDFEKWLANGAHDPAGEIDAAQAGLNGIKSLTQLSRIFHKLAYAEIEKLRDVLGEEPCDEAQKWFDLCLTDGMSDCVGTLEKAIEEAAPNRTTPVQKTPDFCVLSAEAYLTDTGKARSCPEQLSHDEKIKQAALTAGLSGEGVL